LVIPSLSRALLAALKDCGSPRAADAGDPASAADAEAARRGRGIVELRANRPLLIAPEDRARGTDVLRLRVPCSTATIRDAVQLVADTSRLSEANAC
jgi:hypothetical protein